MAGHSPSKTGVNALVSRPSTACLPRYLKKDVDARDKRGHDDGERHPEQPVRRTDGAQGMPCRRLGVAAVVARLGDRGRISQIPIAAGISGVLNRGDRVGLIRLRSP